MFFVLAKILGFFALPSNILISLGILGVLLMATRFARAGRRLAVVALVLLAVAGWSPLGNALILALEERFPPWDATRGAPDRNPTRARPARRRDSGRSCSSFQ